MVSCELTLIKNAFIFQGNDLISLVASEAGENIPANVGPELLSEPVWQLHVSQEED